MIKKLWKRLTALFAGSIIALLLTTTAACSTLPPEIEILPPEPDPLPPENGGGGGNLAPDPPQGEVDPPAEEPEEPETPEPEDAVSETHKVQAKVNLNIRSGPDTGAQVLGLLNKWDNLPYYKRVGGWYKVSYKGKPAYVSANVNYAVLVDVNYEASPVERVIDAGLSVLGTPYEYGAQRLLNWDYSRNPSFTGRTFDCSSFVQYAFYTGAGVKLNMDSRSQSQQGTEIPLSKIRRGDVIFMTSSSRLDNVGIERIGHVAIYLGDNQLLHTYGTGGVRITAFSEFWRGRFIVAKRMM